MKGVDEKGVAQNVLEGRKMENYAEHKTKEMHFCWICNEICYRKKPVVEIGVRWICIDCFRKLKETLDNLKQWEEEIHLKQQIESQLDVGLRTE